MVYEDLHWTVSEISFQVEPNSPLMDLLVIRYLFFRVFLRGQFSGLYCIYVFINDVPERVSSKIQLYADDILLYREIETREDCIKLQMDFDALQN